MNITTRTGLLGFFLALSALPISGAAAATSQVTPTEATDLPQAIESRLARLTAAIRQRETLLPKEASIPPEMLIARGVWGNGNGGGFANRTGPGGFINGGGGGFVNGGGFRNGGGFYNYR